LWLFEQKLLSSEVVDLLKQMLEHNPSKRIVMEKVLEAPLFDSVRKVETSEKVDI